MEIFQRERFVWLLSSTKPIIIKKHHQINYAFVIFNQSSAKASFHCFAADLMENMDEKLDDMMEKGNAVKLSF